jgi:hypothetical protein
MTRQLELHAEVRSAKRHKKLIMVLEYGLAGAVGHSGGILTGFSVKISEWECLMTIRAVRGDVPMVAFIGSDDLINCILKAERDAMSDKLKWREDRYAK